MLQVGMECLDMLKQQQKAWQQVLGTDKVCSPLKSLLSWRVMAVFSAIAVLESLSLMQGDADNAVSVSDKNCSETNHAAAEEQSTVARLDLVNFLSQKTSCLSDRALLLSSASRHAV